MRRKLVALRGQLSDVVDGRVRLPSVDAVVDAYRGFAATVAVVDDAGWLPRILRADTVVFEGAQGVLLDEWHGFHPYTTWSTTTFANAEELLAGEPAIRLGVLRTFTTRHGPGPLVTEDPALGLADRYNATNAWQGRFRVGHFDAVAHRYALAVAGGVDGLALTHLDVPARVRFCDRYDIAASLEPGPAGDLDRQEGLTRRLLHAKPVYGDAVADRVAAIEDRLGAPVVLTSRGPTSRDKAIRARVPALA